MKTTNYNEICDYKGITVGIVSNGSETPFQINARLSKEERSYMTVLEYDREGNRQTEVSDYAQPFDNDFYAALDAKMLRVAMALQGKPLLFAD